MRFSAHRMSVRGLTDSGYALRYQYRVVSCGCIGVLTTTGGGPDNLQFDSHNSVFLPAASTARKERVYGTAQLGLWNQEEGA